MRTAERNTSSKDKKRQRPFWRGRANISEKEYQVKKKILLIDDNKDFGRLLKSFLANKDFEVLLAHTLGEGMAILEKERPEYIFLDNGLPDGSGWSKTSFIQSAYPLSQLNLISAWAPDVPVTNVRILEKPIRINDLMACLQPPSV
jgi:DNA-binding response OmpR family regulator